LTQTKKTILHSLLQALTIYGASGINFILGLAFVPFAVANLGIEGYGLLSVYLFAAGCVLFFELALMKVCVKLFLNEFTATRPSERLGADKLVSGALSHIVTFPLALIIIFSVIGFMVPDFLFSDNPMAKTVLFVTAIVSADTCLGLPIVYLTSRAVANGSVGRYGQFLWQQNLSKFAMLFIAVFFIKSVTVIALVLLFRRVVDLFGAYYLLGRKTDFTAWAQRDRKNGVKLLKKEQSMFWAQISHIFAFESVSVLAYSMFGIKVFGIYRATFDAINKVWFLTTIFPTLVFPYAVAGAAALHEKKNVNKLSNALAISVLLYSLVALLFIWVGVSILARLVPELSPFGRLASLMFVGICANGHARFSMEFLQAFGLSKHCLISNLCAVIGVFGVVFISAHSLEIQSLGLAWTVCFALHACVLDGLLLKTIKAPMTRIVLHCSLLLGLVMLLVWVSIYQFPVGII
jgi:O-antigen/teichoic acid export membrane protein